MWMAALIAGFVPVAVAAAADPGWSMPLTTPALLVVAEPAQGQIIEPLVYGQRTGLSPVAIVLSTLFWTLLEEFLSDTNPQLFYLGYLIRPNRSTSCGYVHLN